MGTQWLKLIDKGYVPLRDNRENQRHFPSIVRAKPVAEKLRKMGYFAQIISAQITEPRGANYYLIMYKPKA